MTLLLSQTSHPPCRASYSGNKPTRRNGIRYQPDKAPPDNWSYTHAGPHIVRLREMARVSSNNRPRISNYRWLPRARRTSWDIHSPTRKPSTAPIPRKERD